MKNLTFPQKVCLLLFAGAIGLAALGRNDAALTCGAAAFIVYFGEENRP